MNAMPMLSASGEFAVVARGVEKSYGPLKVLKGVDLTVEYGKVACILGPSGSGKSTFLRCMNHLERIEKGFLQVGGELIGYREHRGRLYEMKPSEVARQRADIGMVFQSFNLFPHMTVLENIVEAPVGVKKIPKDEAIGDAMLLLSKVGLTSKAKVYPRTLSGGQQQRVAIARALAMDPKLVLLDEITSALDPELVGEVLNTIKLLAKEGTTMLIVTHEMRFARDVAHRTIFMDGGLIAEQGASAKLFRNPQNARLKEFLKRANI